MKLSTFLTFGIAAGALSTATLPALGQTPPVVPQYNIGDAVRQADEARQAAPQSREAAVPVLPRLVEPPFTLKDKSTLLVRHFKVEGAELISEAEIRDILAPYENRKLTLAQIYEAADRITTLYRDRGYLLAKAYVPAQNATRGTLKIKVVPGRYGTIALQNNSLVRDAFLHGVIDHALAASALIHKDELERTMLLISDLPGAGMPRVSVSSGRQPETSDFVFEVPATRRVDGYLLGDNFGSPYTGRNRLSGGLNLNSPLGIGDRLSAFGIVSEDTHLVNGRIAYSLPIGYTGLRAEVAAFRTTYTLGGIYNDLNATGTADGGSATLTYALRRTREDSIYIFGGYTHKALNDTVLGTSIANRSMDLGTVGVTRATLGAILGHPVTTSTTFSFTGGNVEYPDPVQKAINIAGANTVGDYQKVNLTFNSMLALTDRLSLSTDIRAQKSLSGNLDTSEQLSLTGIWGVRSFDEGLAGDSGFIITPELKYALPDIRNYRHFIGVFTDVGAAWIENAAYTTLQKAYTQINDVGLGYYATYEYLPGRALLLKAMVAHSYDSNDGARSYDRGTKGLVQIGATF
jgi:hemolysin activation/secretion protein